MLVSVCELRSKPFPAVKSDSQFINANGALRAVDVHPTSSLVHGQIDGHTQRYATA